MTTTLAILQTPQPATNQTPSPSPPTSSPPTSSPPAPTPNSSPHLPTSACQPLSLHPPELVPAVARRFSARSDGGYRATKSNGATQETASQCPSELSSRAEGFISLKAVEGVTTTALLLHVQGLMIHSHGFASD
ncbi:potassium/sodium hyperpolarization-activated cyclic nucleotide-gated channel 2-like isoform X2 [Prunus avium]|uniref:Potassium/sodium hyperpolarization-activated cyclic nucleotide-gated channel 2-like isoform X2 n=1 Tax=Prunus avium TaxID=42229 RepID=A0A6P5TC60_PRUAV|nr:potassium/sodium hyperpolarization-activated cyclic nucleotide-gated channel 2-like isoform X2 [Prunus avium]